MLGGGGENAQTRLPFLIRAWATTRPTTGVGLDLGCNGGGGGCRWYDNDDRPKAIALLPRLLLERRRDRAQEEGGETTTSSERERERDNRTRDGLFGPLEGRPLF
jgi:hypothetical protein